MTLHLLRAFVRWYDRAEGREIKTIDEAEAWVNHIAGLGVDTFHSRTSRRVTRAAELEGGSVYFVGGPRRRHTLFRMPFVDFQEADGGFAICMRPELIRCELWSVGKVRGWRYLRISDAPPDLPGQGEMQTDAGPLEQAAEMPEGMRRDLKDLGLV